jgi:hypothetical protein
MTKLQAKQAGIDSGLESAEHGDFTPAELADKESFLQACHEVCDNKRQYAGHPTEDFNRERNSESLWDAFDEGETIGAMLGWKLRQKKTIKA